MQMIFLALADDTLYALLVFLLLQRHFHINLCKHMEYTLARDQGLERKELIPILEKLKREEYTEVWGYKSLQTRVTS